MLRARRGAGGHATFLAAYLIYKALRPESREPMLKHLAMSIDPWITRTRRTTEPPGVTRLSRLEGRETSRRRLAGQLAPSLGQGRTGRGPAARHELDQEFGPPLAKGSVLLVE